MAAIKTPAIVIFLAGHSFTVGSSHTVAVLDNDALLVGTPANSFVWNHTSGTFDAFKVVANTGGVNANTHPKWAAGAEDFISLHQMLLSKARAKWPGEDIYFVPLGRHGGTMTAQGLGNSLNDAAVLAVVAGASTLVGFAGALGGGNVPARISGISGLTPDINGDYASLPRTTGGGLLTIPISTTGTPSFAGATVNIEPGTWDPGETDKAAIFPDWDASATAAYEALWAADLAPDPRALFVCLGVNDVVYGTAGAFEDGMLRFVAAQRLLLNVVAGEDLPIVWLEPIIAQDTSATDRVTMETIREALRRQARTDQKFVTVNVDTVSDQNDDPVPMTSDGIHPTFRGFMSLGAALFEGLDAIQ